MAPAEPSELRQTFTEEVLEAIEYGHPTRNEVLGYEEYIDLDAGLRSGDERPFVDMHFTRRLLAWLGYEDADWTYNDTQRDGGGDRPDFLVRPNRATAFVVEDKATTEEFSAAHVEQLQKYTAGTQGYALWTNARRLLALRFYPGDTYEILVRVPVDTRDRTLGEQDRATLELFRTLFERHRFVSMPEILDRISLDEEEWQQEVGRPLDDEDAQRAFIDETRELLDKLTTAARVQIDRAEADVEEGRADVEETAEELREQAGALLETIDGLPAAQADPIRQGIDELLANPLSIDEDDLGVLKPDHLGDLQADAWDNRADALIKTVADLREREIQRLRSRKIHQSYQAWRDRYRIIEGDDMTDTRRRNAYAEQVAYTFFIRLLLARILEDRGAVNRLISDGGLKQWRELTQPSVSLTQQNEVNLHGQALLDVLFQRISQFYQHFFSQPVFDWYQPDDYLLALALERLSTFSFADIDRDILGYAYEAYVERTFRNEKGHFLTSGRIVNYILDEAGYEGREVIGRTVLDPAAGSGSFLVQAARRLREALAEAVEATETGTEAEKREKLARSYIRHLESDLVGLEINPFSCYLAELNLFLQALDDILYLWRETETLEAIEQFRIHVTDSLVMPQAVLRNHPTLEDDGDSLGHDQARDVKVDGDKSFDYVMMNPPYINRGIQHDLPDLTDIPFYDVLFGGGDTNYYHAFIRLANYYAADDGVVALICPLQLYGDRSAGGIRQWLAAPLAGPAPDELEEVWRVRSLSRFYERTELFEGVTQAVAVSTWERVGTQNAEEGEHTLTVAGGDDVAAVRRNRTTYEAPRVVAADPRTALQHRATEGEGDDEGPEVTPADFVEEWHDAWAVVADEDRLAAWEQLRDATVTDLATWINRHDADLLFRAGDVNMTRTKPLRPTAEGGEVEEVDAPVPTAGSKDLREFGAYEASGTMDAEADVAAMELSARKKKADADRERRDRVKRIHELSHEETVCVLKKISGIEPARPIKGSLYHRGGPHPLICFEDSLQVLFTPDPNHQHVTGAVFALLVSSVSNFIFSLFSTNQNVNRYKITRLPIPQLEDDQLARLDELGRAAQEAGVEYWNLKENYGCVAGLMDVSPDPREVLAQSNVGTETIETAVLRGHLTFDGPDYHLSTLLDRGDIGFPEAGAEPDYVEAAQMLLGQVKQRLGEAEHSVEVPTPGAADTFLRELRDTGDELERRQESFLEAVADLDAYVLGLYGVSDPETARLVGAGMPWASTGREWAEGVTAHLTL